MCSLLAHDYLLRYFKNDMRLHVFTEGLNVLAEWLRWQQQLQKQALATRRGRYFHSSPAESELVCLGSLKGRTWETERFYTHCESMEDITERLSNDHVNHRYYTLSVSPFSRRDIHAFRATDALLSVLRIHTVAACTRPLPPSQYTRNFPSDPLKAPVLKVQW